MGCTPSKWPHTSSSSKKQASSSSPSADTDNNTKNDAAVSSNDKDGDKAKIHVDMSTQTWVKHMPPTEMSTQTSDDSGSRRASVATGPTANASAQTQYMPASAASTTPSGPSKDSAVSSKPITPPPSANELVESLFPEKIFNAQRELVSRDVLKNKYLGLYFGAHWCAPCRAFAPSLIDWFTNFKAKHALKDKLEIVYVSSDKNEEAFNEYHTTMGFYALPYVHRDLKNKVSSRLGVRGFPTFVILDSNGQVVTKEGRQLVLDDPEGAKFPWTPKPFGDMFGTSFITNQGSRVTRDHFSGKYVGLYFSSAASMPARGFTPQLIKLYNKLEVEDKPFEVILVSSDQEDSAFKDYFAQMPWLAVPYSDNARREELIAHFKIKDAPSLVILDSNLKVVTTDGRRVVGADLDGLQYPWLPKPLNPLDNSAMAAIDELPFLLAVTDGSEEQIKAAIDAITPIAEIEYKKPEPRLRFFYVEDPDEDILDLARRAVKMSPDDNLAILDMVYSKQYVADDQSVTVNNVTAFVQAYLDGELTEKDPQR